MKQFLTLFSAFALSIFSLNAQTHEHRNCAAMEVLERQLQADPAMRQRMEAVERHTENFVSKPQLQTRAVVTIPVVVHIVYGAAAENISDALVQSQINTLNADFRRLNADKTNTPSVFSALATDVEVNFCLAQRDVNGITTNGIMRYSAKTPTGGWGTLDAVKKTASGGVAPWDATKYLNIWVCKIGGGVLGYAQFPGGGPITTDGVVIDYNYFGTSSSANAPYNLGRTATHEVGHWLNLRHIWGDANCGSDLVSDTPTQQTSNYGCPTFPHTTCGNGANGDMFMNYMDYTDDACMNMFSAGQKVRMQALFSTGGTRASLLTSNGCTPGTAFVCTAPNTLSAGSITSTSATVSWSVASGASNYSLDYRVSGATTWTTLTVTGVSQILTGLTATTAYEYRVKTNCATSASAYTTASTFTTTSPTTATCALPTNVNAANITSAGATISWTAASGASNYSLDYRVSGAATWTTLTVTGVSQALTGLAASTTYDYRVKTNCATSASAYTTASTFVTSSTSATCSDTYESNNTLATAKPVSVNTPLQAIISSSTDNDYFSFSNTATSPNIKVTLTNIPTGKDYDLRLYNSAGTNVKSSLLSGTTAEKILYNAAPVGTYRVRVLPYSGFNATACYSLTINIGNTTFTREIEESDTPFEEVKITPNPVADVLNIEWHAEADAPATIRLFDLTGREMKRIEKHMSKEITTVQMDVRTVQNGMYIVTLQQGETLQTKKVVVNH
jgi:Pregnancy-associated plasma protein-A/Secretion system C-terminal sorting domain/Fibronectin type III domain